MSPLSLHAGRGYGALAVSCVALILSLLLVAAAGATAVVRPAVVAPSVVRIAGLDRYGTSAAASKEGWTSAPCVVIATGSDFPDALAAAPLAHACGGPLLMTQSRSLPASISAEIARLGATEAVIVGGTGAVSSTVESSVATLVGGAGHVKRLAGVNRYDTAAKIAHELGLRAPLGGRVIVATGESYADALSAAPFAAYKAYPILLTRKTTLPPETIAALGSIAPSGTIVVGGTGAVSAAVEALLPAPERIAGVNRYDTARRIAEYADDHGCGFSVVSVAAGTGFADALSGGPLAAKSAGPVLLTTPNTLTAEARACLEAHAEAVGRVYVLGGTASVAQGVSSALERIANGSAMPVFSEQRRISQGLDSNDIREVDTDPGPDGALHIVWRENKSILYRRLDRFGNTVVATVRLPIGTTGFSSYGYPVVAAVPGDGAVVLARSPGLWVWALKLDEQGRLAAGPVKVFYGTTRFLDAAGDEKGQVHVASRNDEDRVLYGVFDADTLRARLALTPVASPALDQLDQVPAVVAWPGGTADLYWFDHRDFPTDKTTYHIYRSRFSFANDSGPYPPGPANLGEKKLTTRAQGWDTLYSESNAPSDQRQPSVSFAADGSHQVAWMDGAERLAWAKFDAAGNQLVSERILLDTLNVFPHRVRVAMRNDGGADIVTPMYFSIPGLLDGRRLAFERLASDGTTRVAPTRLVQAGLQCQDFWFGRAQDRDHYQLVYSAGVSGSNERLQYLDTARDPSSQDRTRCDLVVDDAHGGNVPGTVREGQPVAMTVQVTNAGYAASPASVVRFSKGATTVAEVPIPAMAVDATRAVSATWTVPVDNTEATAHITVRVDPAGAIAETSESNNVVDHPVACRLRPVGTNVALWPLDETLDEAHTDKWWEVDHYHAQLSGTSSETTSPVARTVDLTDVSGPVYGFSSVPPGVYTVTYSATGYSPSAPSLTVTVTRDPVDPYTITYSPSMPVELWFNQWGTIVGQVRSGAPLIPGAVVSIPELSRSVVATDGNFVIDEGPAGLVHLRTTADGYEPIRSQPVTVSVGTTASSGANMVATTSAVWDVLVTGEDSGPLQGATVQIHSATHAVLGSGITGADGMAYISSPAGTAAHVNASATYFVTAESTSTAAPVAGRVYPVALDLALDTSAVTRVNTDWSKWCISSDYYSLGGNDWYGLYRCFAIRMGVDYQDVGPDRKVVALDASAKGYAFMMSLTVVPVDWDIVDGGPFGLGSYPIPWETPERSNVKVEAVKLIDATDGSVLWPAGGSTPWYSHDGSDDELKQTYVMPAGGVVVPDWTKAEVRMWVNVQRVGGEPPHYWETRPLGGGNGRAVIVYRPASGDVRITPWLVDP